MAKTMVYFIHSERQGGGSGQSWSFLRSEMARNYRVGEPTKEGYFIWWGAVPINIKDACHTEAIVQDCEANDERVIVLGHKGTIAPWTDEVWESIEKETIAAFKAGKKARKALAVEEKKPSVKALQKKMAEKFPCDWAL